MNDPIATIRATLETKLNEVSEFAEVKVGRFTTFTGYPACRFYLAAIDDQLLDNQPTNFRTYSFNIDIFQETTNKDAEAAEIAMENAVDAVLDKLNANIDLDNDVEDTQIESGIIEERDYGFGPALGTTIIFITRTVIR